MIEKTMKLTIVSAEAALFSGEVTRLIATGGSGELGIYPGHTALLTAIKPGTVEFILETGESHVYYTSGGFLEVQPEVVTILANTASRAEDLDELAAQTAKEQAEAALSDKGKSVDYAQAMTELAEATAQLRAIQSIRKHIKS
tara:strand:- start:5384 stop:5812 length:429 start_codon:yes stop_codon:yes gene_type:complete